MSTRTRILAVAITAALALPIVSQATASNFAGHVSPVLSHRYERDYHAVAAKLGARAPGRNIVRDGLASGRAPTNAIVTKSIAVLQRMIAPVHRVTRVDGDGDHDGDLSDAHASTSSSLSSAPAATAPTPQTAVSSGGGYANVPGVPSGFAACVARAESSNGAGSSNIYGIIPASGHNVAGMSVAQQKAVMAQIYRQSGASAWAPYDGC